MTIVSHIVETPQAAFSSGPRLLQPGQHFGGGALARLYRPVEVAHPFGGRLGARPVDPTAGLAQGRAESGQRAGPATPT